MIHFQKSHWMTIILGIAVILVIGFIYSLTSLSSMKDRNVVLQKQITEVKSEQSSDIDTANIQNDLSNLVKKVPVEKLVDAIVLDLEAAAIGADSIILNASFTDVEKEPLVEEEISREEEPVDDVDDVQSDEEQPIENVIVPVPDGLEAIAISLTVLSKDYEALTTFLENIRKNTRIYVVESFSFQGFEEGEVGPGPQEDHLEYNVVLSTYYAPVITEVANKFGLVIPPVSNKEIPVYDVLEEKEMTQTNVESEKAEKEQQVPEVEETQNPTEEQVNTLSQTTKSSVRTYVVKPNDTLYSISMKFYKSRNGESLIKKANNRNSDIVIIGETLVIP